MSLILCGGPKPYSILALGFIWKILFQNENFVFEIYMCLAYIFPYTVRHIQQLIIQDLCNVCLVFILY